MRRSGAGPRGVRPDVPGGRPAARVRPWAVLAWLAVWEAVALAVDQPIILPTPVSALGRLAELAATAPFWQAVGRSFARIAAGFALGLAAGCACAALAARFRRLEELLAPAMAAVKAVPVASFVVLALFWFSSRGLSTCIAFLVTLPVFYTQTLQGLRSRDRGLAEMAQVFGIGPARRLMGLAVPQLAPFLASACSLAAGMSWKAGVAAELIGQPLGTVGDALYQAKIYLETSDVLAWTVAVVALSVLCEKLLVRGVRLLARTCAVGASRPVRGTCPKTPVPAARPPRVEVRGVRKAFGAAVALDGASLVVGPGFAVCLSAPSGAGKTTLARLVLGLERPDAGTVAVGPTGPCAACFQEPRLVPWLTAGQNVLFACAARASRADVADAFAALGLAECLDRPAEGLSGGQARRVALARALLADAPLVVLDEAFESLDGESRAAALAWARDRLTGRTVLVVTHERADAAALGVGRVLGLDGMAVSAK